jgi:hypothetical protein
MRYPEQDSHPQKKKKQNAWVKEVFNEKRGGVYCNAEDIEGKIEQIE